jgi:hypothetical protein
MENNNDAWFTSISRVVILTRLQRPTFYDPEIKGISASELGRDRWRF